MKRLLTIFTFALLSNHIWAQSSFSDDFESYSVGSYIGIAAPTNWNTWSNAPGTQEDAQVVSTNASSGNQSIYFNSTSSGGGPQDVVFSFGGQYTTGTFTYQMDMNIPANQGAYFNFQGNAIPGQVWSAEFFFPNGGTFSGVASGTTVIAGTYTPSAWFTFRLEVDFNINRWEVFMDGVSQGTFSNPNNKIASANFYPYNHPSTGGNGQSTFWVDDVSYTHTPYILPATNLAVVGAGALHPATQTPAGLTGVAGQVREISAMVRNLGLNAITSFDLDWSYNGANGSTSVTGVSIPSLATNVVIFTTPVTLALGNFPLVVMVSNVNGMGSDDDPNDDTNTQNVNVTVTPAPDKVVVVEEATGTWCQWCPRGAVFMDYMGHHYSGFIAPIAVHNNDPMLVANYDPGISGIVPGYPSIVTDRLLISDPLDMEEDLITRIAVSGRAAIANGANWNAGTRQLDVSLTYTFSGAADDTWAIACVLTQDSVRGTGTPYNQANAYAGGGNGPMGGYENRPANVPAAQMQYDHVARYILPRFEGFLGLPAVVSPGAVHTFNFSLTLPANINSDKLNIIGMLLNPAGEVDNGSFTSLGQAVTNGFVPGTVVVGTTTPDQPDALMNLFPNPSQGQSWVRLNLNGDTEVQLTVTDIQGRKIAHTDFGTLNGGQLLPINTSGLAKGMYLVETRLNGKVVVKRMIVE